MLDKAKLFHDVFALEPQDTVLVMIDVPRNGIMDHPDWQDRRQMAEEWRQAFAELSVSVLPMLEYPATGINNGDLPHTGQCEGVDTSIESLLGQASIVVAMTEYSATAPLSKWTQRLPDLRVASMPGVLRRMEQTALAADYQEVARRTHLLAEALTQANGANLTFSTGDHLYLDLRYRTGHADDGLCHRNKAFPLINLPSGEAFIVPYEGERPDEPSRTTGTIPFYDQGELFHLDVHENRIVRVRGDGPAARAFAAYLDEDPARANVAELGLGCNDHAVVMGAVIEDEKAGLHWAYGRSEHLGGTVSPADFRSPEHVVHQDIVYAPDSRIGVTALTLERTDEDPLRVIEDNRYLLW